MSSSLVQEFSISENYLPVCPPSHRLGQTSTQVFTLENKGTESLDIRLEGANVVFSTTLGKEADLSAEGVSKLKLEPAVSRNSANTFAGTDAN